MTEFATCVAVITVFHLVGWYIAYKAGYNAGRKTRLHVYINGKEVEA